jgi:hypothetical protein
VRHWHAAASSSGEVWRRSRLGCGLVGKVDWGGGWEWGAEREGWGMEGRNVGDRTENVQAKTKISIILLLTVRFLLKT